MWVCEVVRGISFGGFVIVSSVILFGVIFGVFGSG